MLELQPRRSWPFANESLLVQCDASAASCTSLAIGQAYVHESHRTFRRYRLNGSNLLSIDNDNRVGADVHWVKQTKSQGPDFDLPSVFGKDRRLAHKNPPGTQLLLGRTLTLTATGSYRTSRTVSSRSVASTMKESARPMVTLRRTDLRNSDSKLTTYSPYGNFTLVSSFTPPENRDAPCFV